MVAQLKCRTNEEDTRNQPLAPKHTHKASELPLLRILKVLLFGLESHQEISRSWLSGTHCVDQASLCFLVAGSIRPGHCDWQVLFKLFLDLELERFGG